MFDRPPQHQTSDALAARLAQRLKDQPEALNEFSRARMERSVVEAWRTRASFHVRLPSHSRSRGMRALWAGSLAVSAVAGALVAFYLFGGDAPTAVPVGTARFQLRIGDAAVQSGAVAEGQVLETGGVGAIDVDLGTARLHMANASGLRFERMSAKELTLGMSKGHIDVEFHPLHRGEQRMAIESPAARVLVVGTRFAVDVDAVGNTTVRVSEGVVEVVPRSGAASRRVAAGEKTYVRVDDGDAYERAVRDAIERKLLVGGDALADATGSADVRKADSGQGDLADEALVRSEQRPAKAIVRDLAASRRMLRQGRHTGARERLRRLAEGSVPVRFRVEALTLIAESYTAQADIPQAVAAYKRAEQISPTQAAGHNARFALARLYERYARDYVAAANAYEDYLRHAPQGALVAQAQQALCRLKRTQYCAPD
jgi:hypothetical protein